MKKPPAKSIKTSKPAARPPAKTRDRTQTMEKLMQAGLEVFSDAGFHGATTRMISLKSGVNESLIIRYFESKAGLFRAILVDSIKQMKACEADYAPGDTVEEEIDNYLRFKFETSIENLNFMRMAISNLAIDDKIRDEVDKVAKVVFQPENSELARRLRRFQERGLIRRGAEIDRFTELVWLQDTGQKFRMLVMPHVNKKKTLEEIRFFAREIARNLKA